MLPLRKSNKIMKMLSMSLIDLPSPVNISLWWNYGSLLGLFLAMQIISGVFLSMHYNSSMELAFSSIMHINRNINFGWLLHNMHINGASFFMMCMYAHMGRSIYYMSFMMNKTWSIGVTIFILSMMTAFMGYVLPWGQMSYWGATVITNIFSAIPYLGIQLVEWMWGGFSVSGPTLNRFFVLHFILPFIMVIMVALHLMMLHEDGSNNPLGLNSNSERIPFHTYFMLKDIMGFILFIILFLMVILLYPNLLSDPENFSEANFMMTPVHIQPEWYFLWLYAILRSIPNKLGGVMALLFAIFILYSLPVLNPMKMTSSYYPLTKVIMCFLLISWLILTWIGSCPVEKPYIVIGQMSSIMYFSSFLMIPFMSYMWNKS